MKLTHKQVALESIQRMPETATLDEIARQVQFLAAVEVGLDEVSRGNVVSHEDVKREFIMKTKILCAGILTCIIATLASGCSKSDSTTSATPADTKKADMATSNVNQTAKDAAAAVQKTATQGAQAVETDAKQAANVVSDQVQGTVDKAKSYIASNQYRDAMNSLNSLMNVQLNPTEQKMVDDLKTQVQKLMASDAAKSMGGLLSTNK